MIKTTYKKSCISNKKIKTQLINQLLYVINHCRTDLWYKPYLPHPIILLPYDSR